VLSCVQLRTAEKSTATPVNEPKTLEQVSSHNPKREDGKADRPRGVGALHLGDQYGPLYRCLVGVRTNDHVRGAAARGRGVLELGAPGRLVESHLLSLLACDTLLQAN
jgi:hypothetical protein